MTGEAKTLLGIGIITVLLFVGGIMALTRKNTPAAPQSFDPAVLVREDSFRIGAEEPQVTLVEFSDLQCPFCAQAHPVVEELLTAHPDQLAYVFRHFPLLQHQHAVAAAEAAEAAGAQGKYWEMATMLFERQSRWESSSDPLPIFREYAGELALDLEQYDRDMSEHTYREKIQQGIADGNTAGVNATPTFFIDGEKFSGSLGQLKAEIESRLQ
jgi:protein-disulfide isomerase